MNALSKIPFIPTIMLLSLCLSMILPAVLCIEGCTGKIGKFSTGANRFIEDVSNEQYSRAYAQMSDSYRLRVSRARFQEAVSGHPNLRGAHAGHFRKLVIHGGSATLTGVLKTDSGDVPVVFYFSRSAQRWAVEGVTIGGLPAVP